MTRPRFLATSSLLGIAFALAAPFAPATAAAASGGMTVTIDTPGEGQVFGNSNTVTVNGSVTPGLNTVDVIQVRVVRGDGTTVADTTLCQPCESAANVPFSYTTPALAYNGPYTVVVGTAGSALISTGDGSAARTFALAVPPPAPTGVAAEVLPDRKVRVTWKPVTGIPDLVTHVVFRRIGSGDWQPIAPVPEGGSYVDDKVASLSGVVQYQVAALRQGAAYSNDPNKWLRTDSAVASATLPVPSTTAAPDGQGTTTTVLGGVQPNGAIGGADLSGLFNNRSGASTPQFPSASPPPTLPDTGYSETLPFGPTTATVPGPKVEGRQPGRPATATGSGDIEEPGGDDTNRRALLVPVAAGSVLCVTALHLRWLNRRLAVGAVGAAGALGGPGSPTGPGGPDGPAAGDFEPVDPEPEADRVPVGASGSRSPFL